MTKKALHVLVIDIGNTSVCAGVYRAGKVRKAFRLSTALTHKADMVAWITEAVDDAEVDAVYGCTVVPAKRALWTRVLRNVCEAPVGWLDCQSPLGVPVKYPEPETLGADRLANVAGAHALAPGPALVVDMGTAITIDVIEERGFVGGVIAPGGPLMMRALHQNTAQLPSLAWARSRRVIGRSTAEAMTIGADRGCRALVDGLVEEVLDEMGAEDPVTVFATGGNARAVLRGSRRAYRFEPNLTLVGLGAVAERETDGKST